jgi:hypothetical protein
MPDETFDPSQPLTDKETEEEVQQEFRARERLDWLRAEAAKKRTPAPKPKKGGGVFRRGGD